MSSSNTTIIFILTEYGDYEYAGLSSHRENGIFNEKANWDNVGRVPNILDLPRKHTLWRAKRSSVRPVNRWYDLARPLVEFEQRYCWRRR